MWTYRVVRETLSYTVGGKPASCERYSIAEVHDGGGYSPPRTVEAFREEAGDEDPMASLRWQLDHMRLALDKPVHDGEDRVSSPPAPEAVEAIRAMLDTYGAAPDDDLVGPYGALSFGHLRELLAYMETAPAVENYVKPATASPPGANGDAGLRTANA